MSGSNSAPEMRVLLAEDTPISAEAMKTMASHFSVELEHASNGLEAIEMVEQARKEGRPYSLLLLDVMMPIVDGVEATKRLRARGFDADQLPIIAVTAAASFDETRSYRAAGMQAFLAKPVKLADLRATFEAWGHGDRPSKCKSAPKIDPTILKALGKQFDERNERTLDLIESTLAADAITSSEVEEIRNLLHQIAGTATTFGDANLSKAARSHEHALNAAASDPDEIRGCLKYAARTLRQRIAA